MHCAEMLRPLKEQAIARIEMSMRTDEMRLQEARKDLTVAFKKGLTQAEEHELHELTARATELQRGIMEKRMERTRVWAFYLKAH